MFASLSGTFVGMTPWVQEDGSPVKSERYRAKLCLSALFLAAIIFPPVAGGQGLERPSLTPFDDETPLGIWNLESATLGGMQFWTDRLWCDGWRIQKNAVSGHCRLINDQDVRLAWGNESHCSEQLQAAKQREKLSAPKPHVVVLIHGLIRSRDSMESFAEFLQPQGDWTVVNWQYASTRHPIHEHAANLRQMIDQLGPGVRRIDFVAHSLGNLVLRRYLHDEEELSSRRAGSNYQLGRIVMWGPPNNGSRMARLLKPTLAFNVVCGPSGRELSTNWDKVAPTLAIPQCEFGIIAGGEIAGAGFDNFLLPGQDDLTVSVAETRLPGATDSLIVPIFHGSLMRDPQVHSATLQFLRTGQFDSNRRPQPQPSGNQ